VLRLPDFTFRRPKDVREAATILAGLMATATVVGLDGPWVVLPLLFVLLGSYGFLQGNTMAGAMEIDPRRAGSISALLGGVAFGAGAVASGLAGVFHDGTARPMGVLMLCATTGSALAIRYLAPLRRGAAA